MTRSQSTLTELARAGFSHLNRASLELQAVEADLEIPGLLSLFAHAADPDLALHTVGRLLSAHPDSVRRLLTSPRSADRLLRVLGASRGLGEFFLRRPDSLRVLAVPLDGIPDQAVYRESLLSSVDATEGQAQLSGEAGRTALRVCYREHLAQLAAWDLSQADPLDGFDEVAAGLADLAGAALEAGLALARAQSRYPRADVDRVCLSIIGMGKTGARELNYVSDVDVIFVAEASTEDELALEPTRVIEIATALAMETMRIIHDYDVEPGLWEVDANLRPEGKNGALVRSLASHIAYYERWAKSWEFQALLKARPIAGDVDLGRRYVEAMSPMIWSSASRENFVESVQRMRERVTDHIPVDEVDRQLKLGPGGLRDVEFTIQLLQLVHGQLDDGVRQPGTISALTALGDRGYIGRADSAEFARDYRVLRLMEHRLQLSDLARTHLMPTSDDAIRILARATGLASTAAELITLWGAVKRAVRSLHEKLFYRPLLGAVAALRDDGLSLTSSQAEARLAAIGFRDARGALGHIQALTTGVSRRAAIQRQLLPVMLQWFADGADPDYGLLAFRRLSDDLGESHWFLRMLRDSSGAAARLTAALSSARYIGVLLERIPEAAAWFDTEEELRPRTIEALLVEARATVARHDGVDSAALALRTARRREVLRLAIATILGLIDVVSLGRALTDVTTTILTGMLELVHHDDDGLEFGIVGMGRYGGQELGFGSDTDVVYVYRATTLDGSQAQNRAEAIVQSILRHTEDLRLPLDLDITLRPEGKNGPVVRSLDSYRAYYRRWSLTWEAQALLRARGMVGTSALLRDFEHMADEVRFPASIAESELREVRRIKARMESERLPGAADPTRHVKLGRGSLSDVEWVVQIHQLQHALTVPGLRTTSTLRALDALEREGMLTLTEAAQLRDAWLFASRVRSAMTLWMVRTTNILPADRPQLEGIARLMKYPPGSAAVLEDDYLRVTRRARRVFEKRFFAAP